MQALPRQTHKTKFKQKHTQNQIQTETIRFSAFQINRFKSCRFAKYKRLKLWNFSIDSFHDGTKSWQTVHLSESTTEAKEIFLCCSTFAITIPMSFYKTLDPILRLNCLKVRSLERNVSGQSCFFHIYIHRKQKTYTQLQTFQKPYCKLLKMFQKLVSTLFNAMPIS